VNTYIYDKLAAWRESPLLFATECLQVVPSEQQVFALTSFNKAKRTSIRSGHGCGKSSCASWLILWFLCTRPYAKVACTAPTSRQLSDILWSEMSKWLRKSVLNDEFVIQKDKIFHKSAPKEWWARAISPSVKSSKDEQAETLAGLHGDHLLIVCDEASGIPDPVFIPLEGAMTQDDNKVLLIGNMTRNTGYFYETHFKTGVRENWNCLHWDSRESSNVTPDMVNYFAKKYGIDSNVFRIRVMGEPPLDSENTLIPMAWAMQCMDNEVIIPEDEPLYLGVDVARYGEDSSVILPRQGLKISPWQTFQSMDTITLGGFINEAYVDQDASGLAIDEIGVGAGVTDWLLKHGRLKCFGVNVARASSDITKYDRLRDELWIRVRDKCMRNQYQFPSGELGQTLCDELSQPTYTFNAHGGYKVESKRDMKSRGVMSPNIADALCLTEYFASFSNRVFGSKSPLDKKKSRLGASPDAWMYM